MKWDDQRGQFVFQSDDVGRIYDIALEIHVDGFMYAEAHMFKHQQKWELKNWPHDNNKMFPLLDAFLKLIRELEKNKSDAQTKK